MLLRRLLAALPAALFPVLAVAQALDPASYVLTPDVAAQFVGATQQMVASGASGPDMQGNGMDLARVKAALEQNSAASAALAAAGLSATDYVLFMGAAMQAMMVGQMEQAGVHGMLPPGVTTRPPQQNIDFMRSHADLFTRAMTPGAAAAGAASAPQPRGGEDLPVPADAGSVLPSHILAQIPRLDAIRAGEDCSLARLPSVIERESARARELEGAYYGNPGDAGLARTPSEGRVLERRETPS